MRIVLLLIALLIVAWLSVRQLGTSNNTAPNQAGTMQVPQNAQDLKQLKSNVDALVQKSADNTQQQIDAATKPEQDSE